MAEFPPEGIGANLDKMLFFVSMLDAFLHRVKIQGGHQGEFCLISELTRWLSYKIGLGLGLVSVRMKSDTNIASELKI